MENSENLCNLDKYIFKFGQIHFQIWTNAFSNLEKYILKFGKINSESCALISQVKVKKESVGMATPEVDSTRSVGVKRAKYTKDKM